MTDINKRHFCKTFASLSLIPLLKVNILSANAIEQNHILSGFSFIKASVSLKYYQVNF